MLTSLIQRLLGLLLHLSAIFVIFLSFAPVARWYLGKIPVLGVGKD